MRQVFLQWHCLVFYSFGIALFNKCERKNVDSLTKRLALIIREQFDWYRARPKYRNIDRRSGTVSILSVCPSVQYLWPLHGDRTCSMHGHAHVVCAHVSFILCRQTKMYGFLAGHVSGTLHQRVAPSGLAARPEKTTERKNGK